MKKLIIAAAAIVVAVLVFGSISQADAVAVKAKVYGNVNYNQNTPVTFSIKNGYAGTDLRNVTLWVPNGWTIAYPSHNILVRNTNYGPWSTLVKWQGASGRNGYTAIQFVATKGTDGISKRRSESFPITLKTPTNVRMYNGQKVKVYWQASDDKGNTYRGYTFLTIKK